MLWSLVIGCTGLSDGCAFRKNAPEKKPDSPVYPLLLKRRPHITLYSRLCYVLVSHTSRCCQYRSLCGRESNQTDALDSRVLLIFVHAERAVIAFRTAIPFRGQTTQTSSSLSPKRDCGSKRVKKGPKSTQSCSLPVYCLYEVASPGAWSYTWSMYSFTA